MVVEGAVFRNLGGGHGPMSPNLVLSLDCLAVIDRLSSSSNLLPTSFKNGEIDIVMLEGFIAE